MDVLLDPNSRREPASRPSDRLVEVLANAWENAEYNRLALRADAVAASAAPGQFFDLECPAVGLDHPFLRRPMSVYAVEPPDSVVFLYKVTGAGTRGLASLKPGDSLRILGPLGRGFDLDPAWRSIVLLGRGVGIATLGPLADQARERGVRATVILSARSRGFVLAAERFGAAGAQVEVVLDDDGTSAPESVERRLRALIADGRADAFFTCGSHRLLVLMQRLGAQFGIPGQVALEQQMACGLGMCFCCVRNFRSDETIVSRRVCWDGPVFSLAETVA
jgi:dihydroorotate dehydrogenase electron transfer subunit